MEKNTDKKVIDVGTIAKMIWERKKTFLKVWAAVFVLSCIWILPKPRYYLCSVSLAPEAQGEMPGGGSLSSLASSFGLNLGGMTGSDAIYPTLYPDLFDSNEFMVGLMNIQVETLDGTVKTDYYSYLCKHQKHNPLTWPFRQLKIKISSLFSKPTPLAGSPSALNPFNLSYNDFLIVEFAKELITCDVDKKTDVISITVKDQDSRVCASMADSVRVRLQEFITEYRTSKARMDMEYYGQLSAEAQAEYDAAVDRFSAYCDRHMNVILQSNLSERDKLENDIQIRLQKYTTMQAQYEAMKVKVQERTPAFTTLKSATMPVKPAGPKRMIFVAAMLVFSTFVTAIVVCRKYLMTFLRVD